MTAEDFRAVQTPSFSYLLIPAVAIGFLAACGHPEPTEPVDPAGPESAKLKHFETLAGGLQISGQPVGSRTLLAGQEAGPYISFEYYQ